MNINPKDRWRCPLCRREGVVAGHLDDDDDHSLLDYIHKQFRTWDPDEGACSECIRRFRRELGIEDTNEGEQKGMSGETTIIRENPGNTMPALEKSQAACLLVIHGDNLGKRYELEKRRMIIGRSMHNDIPINDENVSRQHAELENAGRIWKIKDLESTNGTFVNTKRIQQIDLQEGDLILVGNSLLKFVTSSSWEGLYHQEIYRLATVDGLTKTLNKAYVVERLEEEFGRSRRYQRNLSLILFDFDHFKQVNDDHGHPAGDFVLEQACGRISKSLRKEDVIGRFGGEEFMIILPETKLETAVQLAEKMRTMMEKEHYAYEGKLLQVTASLGVAAVDASMKTHDDLLKAADKALYEAKRSGRNKVSVSSS